MLYALSVLFERLEQANLKTPLVSLLEVARVKIRQSFIFLNADKQVAPCGRTVKEVSFEWSHPNFVHGLKGYKN